MDGPSSARLYWPTGGRMVQADPIITDIYSPQNWNPYSYVLNNPLNLTDPSGYSFISKYWRTIMAIVVTVYTDGLAATRIFLSEPSTSSDNGLPPTRNHRMRQTCF